MTYDTGDTWTTNIRHSKEILDYNFKKLMLFGIGFLAQIGITEVKELLTIDKLI